MPFTVKDIMIKKDLCKGCGICIDVCPRNVLTGSDEINEYGLYYPMVSDLKRCIVCRLCELYCPDFAVEVHV